MKPRSLADFMFTGVVVIPGSLVWFDQIGLALFAFTALLIAACLCGWREQVDGDPDRSERGDGDPNCPEPRSRDSAVRRTRTTDRDPPACDNSRSPGGWK